MPETIAGHLYDYPRYYDLVFGSDWKAEYNFLLACFEKHSPRPIERVFEPACGTGRLLVRLADAGYEVAGNDLNSRAVDFCNARLVRRGHPATAEVGDMSDFRLRRKVDAAFNMINSFRHLPSEEAAEAHLKCVAASLRRDGLYLLGLHLTPTRGSRCGEESWSARRGHLAVLSHLWTIDHDPRARLERVGMTFDIHTPTRQFRLSETLSFRSYTARQFKALLARVPEFRLLETYDFCYSIDEPAPFDSAAEDLVFVLQKQ